MPSHALQCLMPSASSSISRIALHSGQLGYFALISSFNIAFIILVKFRYKKTIRNSIIKILVSFVIFIIMEVIVGIIVSLAGKEIENKYTELELAKKQVSE